MHIAHRHKMYIVPLLIPPTHLITATTKMPYKRSNLSKTGGLGKKKSGEWAKSSKG